VWRLGHYLWCSSHQHNLAPTRAAATTPAATAPARTANHIPQGGGGDHDADNSGGPSDGDGNRVQFPRSVTTR
jgi:hypothetical protein